MRTHTRFQPLRTPSLRRLKTAFSPHPAPRSTATSPSSSTRTTSPLTRTSSPDSHFSAASSASAAALRTLLLLRRRPSSLDREMEEERLLYGAEMAVLEPRPDTHEIGAGGIFEVLEGRS